MATVALAAALAPVAAASRSDVERLLAPPAACPSSTDATAPADVQVRAMACLVEYARDQAGLPSLRVSRVLDRAAAMKIDADVRCGQFSHTPCGSSFMSVFSRSGYTASATAYAVGENLAWSPTRMASPREVMNLWLHSPEHLRNLLSPQWREFGLGLRMGFDFLGVHGASLWANEFGARH
ncbi:MAG TPA: CAP domain-containing protein [Gaiellaceae bacterium]|nr:CAP domain-containing protein [Gaiellaceae bacterium]